MRIAVLADTHVNTLEHLPKKIIDAISTVDLIIHTGDFTDVQVLEELKQHTVINDILVFNPGKATDSFGILTIDGAVKGEIINSR